ncbi:LCP family protein [Streptomyces sp. JJ66]|uniref:LCP family protein n=1 Tax=Streptomyces sp. JJ66 TaxID=2803843 RepID=UPI001C55C7F8|nr:LCP family protein [Streptomyces sp. JJ66]MBW1601855.1 LCP family protein [Streptomyces sp. JJ66]
MDAQGRGHAGDIDPADQWVFNPRTGSYELRLPGAADSATGGASSASATPHPPRQRSGDTAGRPAAERAAGGAARTASGTGSAGRPGSTGRAGSAGRTGAAANAAGTGTGRRRVTAEPRDPERRVPGQRSRRAADPSGPGSPHSRRKPKPKPSGKKKALRWGGGALALLVLGGCTTAYVIISDLNDNIDKVDVGFDNPATSGKPVNILLIGTDARTGEGNTGYGDAESVGHADTTLLLHVSKDRSNASVLSFPRDMIVDIPDCETKQPDGSTEAIPGQRGVRFNESLGQNGRDPGCTWKTVQELSGIKINHFMMADFNAVKTLSTAVGGVEVCVAKDIDDPKSHLKLDAGRHVIEGEQALAFVRTRNSVGLGSDLSRIELQQQFLSSMFRKLKSSETLTDPGKLYSVATAATEALTVDTGIGDVQALSGLARDLSQVNPKNITFATVPVLDNPAEAVAATVVLDEAKARPLFEMVKADKSLAATKKDKKKKDDGPSVPKAPAEQVRVDVFNGGGPIGAAQQTVNWLQNEQGVPLSTNAGNASAKQEHTRLTYGPDQAGQAATLAGLMGLPKAALKEDAQAGGEGVPMTLVLGADFTSAGTPLEAPDNTPEGVQKINGGDQDVCAQ